MNKPCGFIQTVVEIRLCNYIVFVAKCAVDYVSNTSEN